MSDEQKQPTGRRERLAGRHLRAVGRREDHDVPQIARRAAGHDPRHHLHDARAARGRKGWRGLLFPGRDLVSEAGAGGKFSGARHGLRPQLRHAEVRGARQAAAGQGRVAQRGRAGRGRHPQVRGGGPGVETGAGDGVPHAAVHSVLEQRLRKRGTDATAVIQKRLGVARQEVAQWKNFDYLLISRTVAEDLRRMQAIVEAEKMRTARIASAGVLDYAILIVILLVIRSIEREDAG